MKKIILLLLMLFCVTTYAQKKKKSSKKKVAETGIIAKNNDLTAELIKNEFYLFKNVKKAKKDTLLLKSYTDKILPVDCTITPFKAKGTGLYAITWSEKKLVETTGKKEEINTTFTQIWDPTTKKQVFTNEQKSTKITEQVFLDRLKNASETQERMRNEGSTFSLLPDGDFMLKTKTAQTKYTFNATAMKFEVKKK